MICRAFRVGARSSFNLETPDRMRQWCSGSTGFKVAHALDLQRAMIEATHLAKAIYRLGVLKAAKSGARPCFFAQNPHDTETVDMSWHQMALEILAPDTRLGKASDQVALGFRDPVQGLG